MTPLTDPSPSVTDINRLDTTTASGVHLHEAHGGPTNDHCEYSPMFQNTEDMTIQERLKKMEEVAGKKLKADPLSKRDLTLEQRVPEVEKTLTKHLHVNDGSESSHDGVEVMPDLGTLHTGSSQTSSLKVSDAAIKEQQPAKAKTLFKIP